MKSKFLSFVMLVVMICQCFGIVTAFADTSIEIDAVSYSVNETFSDASKAYSVSNVTPGICDYQILGGQYGKAPNDKSIRLYSVGGTESGVDAKKTLKMEDYSVPLAGNDQYTHLSYQYLNEDGFSALAVNLGYYLPDNETKKFDKQFMTQPRTATIWRQSRFLPNAGGGSNKINYDDGIYGSWNQVDIYFSPTQVDSTTIFINGKKYVKDFTNWNKDTGKPEHGLVGRIFRVEFIQNINSASPYEPTAIQIDNVIVEVVDSVPENQNYRHLGETFNFDDNVTIDVNTGKYLSSFGYSGSIGKKERFSTVSGTRQAVQFKSGVNSELVVGAPGRKLWDTSAHTVVPSDASEGESGLQYSTIVSDLKSGESGHLTFAIANSGDVATGLTSTGAKFGGTTAATVDLFEMASDGSIKFFETDTGKDWTKDKWYKVDMVYNVSTDTKVDCYIDGEKVVSDYVLSDSPMTYPGLLKFDDKPGADYYIDDVGFRATSSSEVINPSHGWSLTTSNSDLEDCINNKTLSLLVPGNYTIAQFKANINNPEYVKFYNAEGIEVSTGLMGNCILYVSNTFGSGVYYTIETTGVMTEAELFDIADGSVVIVANVDALNVSATGESTPVERLDIYLDGKLLDSVQSDNYHINLSELMLGKHTFEAYGYVNEKDCYIDTVSLTLIEEKEGVILATNNFDSYTANSGTMAGGRVVREGARSKKEVITDKYGVNYGDSLVLESTKELYQAAGNKHNLYIDISTPEANKIRKAVLEFDVCYLSDKVKGSSRYRGKSSLTSTDNTAATLNTATFGVETTVGDATLSCETNKWYHVKMTTDLRNGVHSLWIDGVPLVENKKISTSLVQFSSEMRIQFNLPTGAYDNADVVRFAAFDNFSLTEYDELAYIDSIEDANGLLPVDYTSEVITVNMSEDVEKISTEDVKLISTNGERPVKSVVIDQNDPKVIYVTPKYKLSSGDAYKVVFGIGLKSAGGVSTKPNSGIFETTAKDVDIVSGVIKDSGSAFLFDVKLSNKSTQDQNLIIISYVYDGGEFKGIVSKTVMLKPGKSANITLTLPYYSSTAKVYGLVTDSWETMQPITNKLYSNGF